MALDFPTSPSNGDTYDDFYWDATAGIWRRQLSTVDVIDDLTNVDAASPNDGDILVYNASSEQWVAQTDTTIGLVIALGG